MVWRPSTPRVRGCPGATRRSCFFLLPQSRPFPDSQTPTGSPGHGAPLLGGDPRRARTQGGTKWACRSRGGGEVGPRLLYGRTKGRQDLFGRAGHFRILPGDASPSLEMKAHALRVLNSHFFPIPSFTQASPKWSLGWLAGEARGASTLFPLGI